MIINHIYYDRYILQMRITLLIITILASFFQVARNARAEITDTFNNMMNPKRNLTYRVINGYEDIDNYMPGETASVYYSLWECSTKNFSDHSTPIIFYLSGGPGLSSQHAAYREFGPIQITYENGNYTARENPWSWNYYAHLVFVDQPVGTGYSYNKGKLVDNTKLAANHFINFLNNFMKNNGYGLDTNPYLYLAGEGFAGHYIPVFFQAINTNTSIKYKIEGVILGGGLVDVERQFNYYESILAAAGIVSQKRRNITQQNMNQAIIRIRNQQYNKVQPFFNQILSDRASDNYYNGMDIHNYKWYTADVEGKDFQDFLKDNKKLMKVVPDNVNFVHFNQDIFNAFANNDLYRSFTQNFQYMLKSGKRILVYNGQNDVLTNTPGVLTYLNNLEWPGARDWRQAKKQIWKQSGIISGWFKKSSNFIFVIVKGAGHYIFEDETKIDKAIYLMLGNYITKKW